MSAICTGIVKEQEQLFFLFLFEKHSYQKLVGWLVGWLVGQKRKSISSQLGEAETFTLLILHLAFDLFTQPEATIELLQDIYVCRQKAAKKPKAKHEDDGGMWVNVFYVCGWQKSVLS